jgi:hypothetical protein
VNILILDFVNTWFCLLQGSGLGRFYCTDNIYVFFHPIQGSPNQSKWATSSPWFHWNCPISVKKRSFSRPVSLFKSRNTVVVKKLEWPIIEIYWASRPKNLTRIFTGDWTDGFSKKYVNLTAVRYLCFFPSHTGLTKPVEVGDFFALVSLKLPSFCQKAKF